MEKKYGVFSSSIDPQKLSMTVRGVLKTAGAVAIALAPFLNVGAEDVSHLFDSLNAFMDGFDTLMVSGLAVWGLGEAVWGAVRKFKK